MIKSMRSLLALAVVALCMLGYSTNTASANVNDPPPDCVTCNTAQECVLTSGPTEPGWLSCERFHFEGQWHCQMVGKQACGPETYANIGGDGGMLARGELATQAGAEDDAPERVEYREGATAHRRCNGTLTDRAMDADLADALRRQTMRLSL